MHRSFTDQLNRSVTLDFPPGRIVSLVPSQTELLYHLGLEEEVVGITKFCVEPESWFRSKTRVGGTKQIHFDRIADLKPDLILANKEENDRSDIMHLERQYPVWISDIQALKDALMMIRQVGEVCRRSDQALSLIQDIRQKFDNWEKQRPEISVTAAYFIWAKPLMVAGGHTFINHLMERAGFRNVFAHLDRYPEVTEAQVLEQQPEAILLSSEPFPFKEKHLNDWRQRFPESQIVLVDGMAFSWYGSRLYSSPDYFAQLHRQITAS